MNEKSLDASNRFERIYKAVLATQGRDKALAALVAARLQQTDVLLAIGIRKVANGADAATVIEVLHQLNASTHAEI